MAHEVRRSAPVLVYKLSNVSLTNKITISVVTKFKVDQTRKEWGGSASKAHVDSILSIKSLQKSMYLIVI